MRYIRYGFWALVGLVLIVVGLANREVVRLDVLPPELGRLIGWEQSVQVPLFAVIFGGVAAGLLIGFVWEWLREYRHRAAAARRQREVHKLQREVTRLRGQRDEGKDEVLAILDEAS